jgi:hypothetical protein
VISRVRRTIDFNARPFGLASQNGLNFTVAFQERAAALGETRSQDDVHRYAGRNRSRSFGVAFIKKRSAELFGDLDGKKLGVFGGHERELGSNGSDVNCFYTARSRQGMLECGDPLAADPIARGYAQATSV